MWSAGKEFSKIESQEQEHKKLKSILLCVTYRPPDCPVTCFVDDLI